jgi:uncharacterized protein
MRWRGRPQSRNVEDRRTRSSAGRGIRLGGGGLVGLLVIMGLVWLLGGNPLAVLSTLPQGGSPGGIGAPGAPLSAEDEEHGAFVATVLADTERVWGDLFLQAGRTYRPATLVLFRGATESGCGFASAATGPFYCPQDEKIYIDLSFFDQLAELGGPGDFAQAYVIAHEVAHHVQHLLGTAGQVHSARGRVSEREYNDLSVRLELQADFLAGVWAHHAEAQWDILEPGDLEEAIRAAGAIGDDRLQRRSQGYVVPDSFTHGTSEQRIRWFRRGFEMGDPAAGDTFAASDL